MVFGSRWLDASERRPFSPHGPFPRQQRRSGSHVQGLVRERPECHADVKGAGTEFSIAHDLSLRGQQNCRSVGLSCGMTKWLGKTGEQQVPPLRYAPVGMTHLFGYQHSSAQTNLSSRPERSVVEGPAVAFALLPGNQHKPKWLSF